MNFTFGSWNLNNRSLNYSHVELLRAVDCDLLAIQEASAQFHAGLSKLGLFDWSVSSLALRRPGADEGRARRLGCSVFGRRPFALQSSALLTQLELPERALIVHAIGGAKPVTVCSFHIPPGATWGAIKPQTMRAIGEWLGSQPGSVVVGMDANSPKTDHPDPLQNEWWWKDEPALLGPTPSHQLRDAFRTFLGNRPDLFNAIKAVRPAGPLAVSHLRGSRVKDIPCRYDVILVSSDLTVANVEYRPLNNVLSDHALVVGHFEVNEGLPVDPSEGQAFPQPRVVSRTSPEPPTGAAPKNGPRATSVNAPRRRKRPRLNFDDMGIPADSVLKSGTGNVTVRVTGPHTVRLADAEMTLTEATRWVLGPNFNGAPCPQWTFNGKSLGKIYAATYGPR